jgi:hypothetical protein
MTYKTILRNNWLTLVFFIVLSSILYFPVLYMSFVSDDFQVMRRIVLDRILLVKGFFRPLSDLTLYFNYLIGGFNPFGYYLFGILLHGLNSFLLFTFCKKWRWTSDDLLQEQYALLAAILFVCYPFHNESIVWVLGRASSMASTFGILALIFLVGESTEKLKITAACLCYFIGLTSYESIMLLPAMVMVILYKQDINWRRYTRWITALSVTLILHLIIRIKTAGVLVGSYGENFFRARPLHYLANLVKGFGRLFIPPIQQSTTFSLMLVISSVLLMIVVFLAWRRMLNRLYLFKIVILVLITLVIPVLFGVSTKTSESDRFLHFPSFFLCCGISFVLLTLISGFREQLLAALLIFSYFIFFLEKNNQNWLKASDSVKNILQTIQANKGHQKVFIINLPDEYFGAYIFRLGLKDAMLISGLDTSRLVIVNHLSREQMLRLPELISPVTEAGETKIPPAVTMKSGMAQTEIHCENVQLMNVFPEKDNIIFFWNNRELVRFQPRDTK